MSARRPLLLLCSLASALAAAQETVTPFSGAEATRKLRRTDGSGRVLVVGVLYAPYLAGDTSYTVSGSEVLREGGR